MPAISACTSARATGDPADSARIAVSLSIHVGARWRSECSIANCLHPVQRATSTPGGRSGISHPLWSGRNGLQSFSQDSCASRCQDLVLGSTANAILKFQEYLPSHFRESRIPGGSFKDLGGESRQECEPIRLPCSRTYVDGQTLYRRTGEPPSQRRRYISGSGFTSALTNRLANTDRVKCRKAGKRRRRETPAGHSRNCNPLRTLAF